MVMFKFKYLIIILSFFLLVSCNPSKRIHRIAERNGLLKSDTITLIDTVKIASVRADTAFIWSKLTDTLILTKDRLKVTIIKTGDTVEVSGQCDSIIVYKTIKIPYTQIVENQTFLYKYGNLLMFILFCTGVYLLYKKMSK